MMGHHLGVQHRVVILLRTLKIMAVASGPLGGEYLKCTRIGNIGMTYTSIFEKAAVGSHSMKKIWAQLKSAGLDSSQILRLHGARLEPGSEFVTQSEKLGHIRICPGLFCGPVMKRCSTSCGAPRESRPVLWPVACFSWGSLRSRPVLWPAHAVKWPHPWGRPVLWPCARMLVEWPHTWGRPVLWPCAHMLVEWPRGRPGCGHV